MATHEVEKKKQAAKRNEYNVELKFQKLELNCDARGKGGGGLLKLEQDKRSLVYENEKALVVKGSLRSG